MGKFQPRLIETLRDYSRDDFVHDLTAGITVGLVAGAPHQPRKFLKRAEFVDHIGHENILPDVNAALKRAEKIHRQQVA